MEVKIERFDHLGNGIGFIDGKIIFVPFTVPGDMVEVKIIKEHKNYLKGKALRVISPSPKRVEVKCPYFETCGGCQLLHLGYEDTAEYKKERVQNILGIENASFIENESPFNYRNKIELKVKDGKLGFYEPSSHKLCEIESCLITKECINKFIPILKTWNIQNGDITLRCNFNEELIIDIKSKDSVLIDKSILPEFKVLGIVHDGDVLYGQTKFLEKINNHFFEVSYNSFFQVNNYINSQLFNFISENVQGETVLDLYSGVGTLSIVAAQKAKKVYGIEVIPEAVVNAIKNAKINNVDNAHFLLGRVEDKLKFIEEEVNTVIVDPPRSGLDAKTISLLKDFKPDKIIYISCETQKLKKDLESFLGIYEVERVIALDMFSYTYHVECVCVLKLK